MSLKDILNDKCPFCGGFLTKRGVKLNDELENEQRFGYEIYCSGCNEYKPWQRKLTIEEIKEWD